MSTAQKPLTSRASRKPTKDNRLIGKPVAQAAESRRADLTVLCPVIRAEATGSRRIGPGRPAPSAGSRTVEGTTGATGRALTVASLQGETQPKTGSQLELAAYACVRGRTPVISRRKVLR
jgi:hypothetical protein